MAIGTAAAIIGGSIIGGLASSSSAGKQAKAQKQAADTGAAETRRQFDITTGKLESAERANRRALSGGLADFRDQLDPFAEAGRSALTEQQALLGLSGDEAQQSAFDSFAQSPGQKFLQDRAQKNLVRNAAAVGGLGGGNVRSALVQQGVGFGQQDFQNQFGRIQDLSRQGQTAATNIGQAQMSTASGIGSGAINTAARQGQFGAQASGNIAQLGQAGAQAQALGIANQNAAFQQGLGGVFTGLAQGGAFDSRRSGIQLPANNANAFTRTS